MHTHSCHTRPFRLPPAQVFYKETQGIVKIHESETLGSLLESARELHKLDASGEETFVAKEQCRLRSYQRMKGLKLEPWEDLEATLKSLEFDVRVLCV